MELRRPGYIFGAVALAVVLGIVWTFVDTPRVEEEGIAGSVEYCKVLIPNKETAPTSCQVYIPGQEKRVWVYMPSASPGHRVRLRAMRRALTSKAYYLVDYAAEP